MSADTQVSTETVTDAELADLIERSDVDAASYEEQAFYSPYPDVERGWAKLDRLNSSALRELQRLRAAPEPRGDVIRQDNEAHVARAYAAEAELARVGTLADKLWRLCVDEGFPWADGETQDKLTEMGLLYPHDMTGEDESEMCESCDGDCKVCYRAVEHVRDVKQPLTKE
jgi:hypothetical protein